MRRPARPYAPFLERRNRYHGRFTRSNAITEGSHTKMEVLQRQAYGFLNFNQLQTDG